MYTLPCGILSTGTLLSWYPSLTLVNTHRETLVGHTTGGVVDSAKHLTSDLVAGSDHLHVRVAQLTDQNK